MMQAKKLGPCVAFSLLALLSGPQAQADVTAMWTNVDKSGNPLVPGAVTGTDIKAALTPAAVAAHNSAALTGRIFWLDRNSTRTSQGGGVVKITDRSGQGNHGYTIAGGPTWDATTGNGGFLFNGGDARIDVPGVTLAKLPIGSAFTYLITLCPKTPVGTDSSTASSYNNILSLGSYNSLLDRGALNLLQKSGDPLSVVDVSGGVEGAASGKTITLPSDRCSVIAGRLFWNGATGYAKTLLDLEGSRSYGTPNTARINSTRIASSALTIGGDVGNLGRALHKMVVPETQIFSVAVTNQNLTLEANAMLKRAGVTEPTVRMITLLDPVSVASGSVPADVIADCVTGGRCVNMTPAAMTTYCASLPSSLTSSTCTGGMPSAFDADTDRCVTWRVQNEHTGLGLKVWAENWNVNGTTGVRTTSPRSNTLTCAPLAPAIP